MFNNFVRDQVLPQCGRVANGDLRSVIVVDNASIHWNQELVDMLDEAGVELARLPPYLPDLNPTETSFAILRGWIRKHQDIASMYEGDGHYGEFLQLAVEAQAGQANPGNLFRKSGITYDG